MSRAPHPMTNDTQGRKPQTFKDKATEIRQLPLGFNAELHEGIWCICAPDGTYCGRIEEDFPWFGKLTAALQPKGAGDAGAVESPENFAMGVLAAHKLGSIDWVKLAAKLKTREHDLRARIAELEAMVGASDKEVAREIWKGWCACKEPVGKGSIYFEKMAATILAKHRQQAVAEAMQKLLDNAHGGGSWRRIAEQLKTAALSAQRKGDKSDG